MKTLITILSATAFIFVACNQNKPTETAESTNQSAAESVKTCYLATSGKDSVTMSFNNDNGSVTGALAFDFYEKDDLRGEIKGFFKGDTLFVDYTFKAEGTVSKNPLVFLKQGNELQQGSGDIETYVGKTYFKDHSAIKFDEGFLFKPVDCK